MNIGCFEYPVFAGVLHSKNNTMLRSRTCNIKFSSRLIGRDFYLSFYKW